MGSNAAWGYSRASLLEAVGFLCSRLIGVGKEFLWLCSVLR